MIGRRCTRSNALSQPILIAHRLAVTHFAQIAKPPSGHVALPETFDCFPGGHREDETPVPIPNTEVKGLIGEGTAGFARGRVARRRDFSPKGREHPLAAPFFVWKLGSLEVWRLGGAPEVEARAVASGDDETERCAATAKAQRFAKTTKHNQDWGTADVPSLR